MPKSLQEIEDYYKGRGFSGESLRQVLQNDKEFQVLLNERKSQISNKYGITAEEEHKYSLPIEEDYEILSKIKRLDGKILSNADREVVDVIKSQLEDDWRKPLMDRLNQLLEKYQG